MQAERINPKNWSVPVSLLIALWMCFYVSVSSRADSSTGQNGSKPPRQVLVVLFPSDIVPSDDTFSAMRSLKESLRNDSRLEVLEFDPNSASFLLAAQSAGVDINKVSSSQVRLQILNALNGDLAITVTQGYDHGKRADVIISPGMRFDPDSYQAKTITNSKIKDIVDQIDTLISFVGSKILVQKSRNASSTSSPTAPTTPIPTPAPVTPVPEPTTTAVTPTPTPTPVTPVPEPTTTAVTPIPTPTPTTPSSASIPAQVTPSQTPAVATPIATPAQAMQIPTLAQPTLQTAPAIVDTVKPTLPAPTMPVIMPTIIDDVTLKWMNDGDDAAKTGDLVRAIQCYRQAVNESPRNMEPRARLADSYLQNGQVDKSVDEVKRALAIYPDSSLINNFVKAHQYSTPEFADLLANAYAQPEELDPATLIKLGDSYWNKNQINKAEETYARVLESSPNNIAAYAKLAKLYAATERYDECLAALARSGATGYANALKIIMQRTGALLGDLDSALTSYKSGDMTSSEVYESLKSTDRRVQAFSDFIAKINPPPAFKVSYLHRKLSANLLSQIPPPLENYALTADSSQLETAESLEKSVTQEQNTANVADQLQVDLLSAS